MRDQILTLSEKDLWQKQLNSLPGQAREVFFEPQYLALYEDEHARAECFLCQDGQRVLLYPYLKTHLNAFLSWPLEGDYYDVEGAYGYNGIAANCWEKDFLDRCAGAFRDHCRRAGVVAEFVRLNPLLPGQAATGWWDTLKVSQNIVVDLTLSAEEVWRGSYEHCVRKNVKRSQQQGVSIESFEGKDIPAHRLEDFLKVYYHTMDQRGSQQEYYFSKTYFQRICRDLGEGSMFFFAIYEGQAVSCELILLNQGHAYSFLGGTLEQYQQLRPNNLLKHELMGRLKGLGLKRYCLGGGKTAGDGIYRYKKTFAKNGEVDFYIGRNIHDPKAYDGLCRQWTEKFPDKTEQFKDFFLKYRY